MSVSRDAERIGFGSGGLVTVRQDLFEKMAHKHASIIKTLATQKRLPECAQSCNKSEANARKRLHYDLGGVPRLVGCLAVGTEPLGQESARNQMSTVAPKANASVLVPTKNGSAAAPCKNQSQGCSPERSFAPVALGDIDVTKV